MKKTKYLLRKKSGSRSRFKSGFLNYIRSDYSGIFLDETHDEKFQKFEGMSTKNKNGIDSTLIGKWLYSQIGKDFDNVYSEYINRVQPKYLDTHKKCIFWYVEKNVKIVDDIVYKRCDHPYYEYKYNIDGQSYVKLNGFYIHPDTNILSRVQESKKRTISRKDGKIKHAMYKTERNKSHKKFKERWKEVGEKSEQIMMYKKKSSKIDNKLKFLMEKF
jgi:hypothetical protein